MSALHRQTADEEMINTATCATGFILSLAALVILIVSAAGTGSALKIVAVSVYGLSLVLLFVLSTLYHYFQPGITKNVFEILDHCAIYVLIAGSYTPFTLVILKGPWGWSLFAVVWTLALAGITLKAMFIRKLRVLSIIFYLAMGWISVVALKPLTARLAPAGLFWLVAGGVLFSVGILFYGFEKLKHQHAVWHCFVIMACLCHFISILFYVVPS